MKKLFFTAKEYDKVYRKAEKYRERIFETIEKNQKLHAIAETSTKKIKELKKQVESLEQQISICKKEHDELLNSFEQKNLEKNIYETEIEDKLNGQEIIKEYIPLFNSMKQSCLFEELMIEFGVETNKSVYDFDNIICYVRMIGNGLTFTDIMYTYLEQKNSILSFSEKKVIDALNDFYKDMYGIKFDIIIFPNKDKDNRFDKNIMKDNIKRNDTFMYFSDVYVPAIKRDQNSIEKRAIVKGFY